MDKIIDAFSKKAKHYLKFINSRKVFPLKEDIEKMKVLDVPLQEHSIEPFEVINELDEVGTCWCGGTEW